MGGNAKQTILPMAMGIGAGFLMPGGTATTGMFGELVGGAAFNSTAALIGGGLASAMFAETPQVPDFSSNFAEQSAFINTQQSFSRQGDSQLESLLASGTEYEKNQAFDELRRRGADENRLAEISTAQGRSAERQADIQGIANQGYNRLLKGSSLAEEQSRFDLGLTEAERRYQENLRTARTSDQRNVAFQNFQSDLDRQIAVFQQRSQDSRSEAQLGLGIAQAGLISPRDPFAPKPTGTTKAGEKLNTQYDIFKNHASPLVPTIPSNGGTGFGGGKLYGS